MLLLAPPSRAVNLPGELLFFPEVTAVKRFDWRSGSGLDAEDINPGIDIFYSLDRGRLRFLLEWLGDTDSHELQRLQLGWRWRDTSFWLGRFHNPIGYWNAHFHHGAYMMTTISRPGAMAFEAAGGPMPTHLTGLYVEGTHEIGEAGVYYALGMGAGPDLQDTLGAFDVLDPEGSYRPGVTLRLAYQPVSFGPDEFGLSTSYTEIPGDRLAVDRVRQVTAGLYGYFERDPFRFLGEILYIHNDLDGPGSEPAVVNLYGQVEWQANNDWTLYGRAEGTFNEDADAYLAHFPNFVEDRVLSGIRFELPFHMAIKLELSREHVRDDAFGQVLLQWSALFP